MSGQESFVAEEVPVEIVRPLRLEHLRPGQAPESVVYRSDEDPTARHYAVRDEGGRVIGVGSVHFSNRLAGEAPHEAPGMRIRGMAVEEAWQGKGVGAALLEAMLAMASEAGIREAWANARTATIGFYERTGFRPVSHEFDIPTIGPHRVVARRVVD